MRTFAQQVLRKLPKIEDPIDKESVDRILVDLEAKGFTVHEAFQYLGYIEHVNPEIPEDVALRGLARVQALVDYRKKIQSGNIARANSCF